ncbi:MAG: hypothetical protein SPK28_01905 [Bacilli bacterium]|nr:hypothetical protein [Bacilli bacterium]
MEDNKDMEQQPKKRGRKPKVENKVEENQTMDFMNMMTPEMMQMFMKFMESQQKTEVMATSVAEEKPIKWSKAMLNKIKDEMVDVRSVMDGKVIYVSPKTHIKYKWLEKGDIEQLTIEEILAMDTKKMFLRTPLLVVEDERVVEGLGLKGINKLVDKVEDIDQLVEMDLDDMEKTINELPFDYKRNLRDEISKKIENSEIRDYVVVQTLKRIFEI